jgi:hypothetical protein
VHAAPKWSQLFARRRCRGTISLGFARVSHALAGFAQNREKKKAFKLATRSFILPKKQHAARIFTSRASCQKILLNFKNPVPNNLQDLC